jgi:outer membrane protein
LATLTSAQNNKNVALQNLKQLIRLPQNQSLEPVTESLGDIESTFPYTAQQLVDSILYKRPDYKAAKYRVASAEYGLRAAKGALLPTLSLGGSVSTVYSDNAKNVDGISAVGFSPIGRVQGTNEIVVPLALGSKSQTILVSRWE